MVFVLKPIHIEANNAPNPAEAVIKDRPELLAFNISPAIVGCISSIPLTKKALINTINNPLKIIGVSKATLPPSIRLSIYFVATVRSIFRDLKGM